ncbi:BSD domain-containing protein 1-A-like [Gossypium australe]|uniref:BSD domain-containing protein 1-A-like n=1 Tax=Gossypium australe TaxID=47621 RepID=A0A5B6VJ85_9ROSI|nr:BSD domain-containing protein 1-A-like [Gossypium australe]
MGKVTYKLKLPEGTRIYSTFHVSQLKKHVGTTISSLALPLVSPDEAFLKEPVRILKRRMTNKGN